MTITHEGTQKKKKVNLQALAYTQTSQTKTAFAECTFHYNAVAGKTIRLIIK